MIAQIEGCSRGYKVGEIVLRNPPQFDYVTVDDLSMTLADGTRLNSHFLDKQAGCGIVTSRGDVTTGACLLCGAFYFCSTIVNED